MIVNVLTMAANSAARNDYWNRYLADTNPCYFPSLIENSTTETRRKRLPIQFTDDNINGRVIEFCLKNGLAVNVVFKTAWALVLKFYIGSGSLCFGSVISVDDIDTATICNLAVEETDSVLDVAQRITADAARSLPYQVFDLADMEPFTGTDGRIPCNSIVHLRNTMTGKRTDLDQLENVIDDNTDVCRLSHAPLLVYS
jgi:hypothetical protein